MLSQKFEDVSPIEKADLKGFIMSLIGTFPDEYKSAKERYDSRYSSVLRRKK